MRLKKEKMIGREKGCQIKLAEAKKKQKQNKKMKEEDKEKDEDNWGV